MGRRGHRLDRGLPRRHVFVVRPGRRGLRGGSSPLLRQHRRLPTGQPLVLPACARVQQGAYGHHHQGAIRLLQLGRQSVAFPAHLVPRDRGWYVHGTEPRSVARHRQRPVRRARRGVPEGERHAAAGPGSVRGCVDRPEQAGTSSVPRRLAAEDQHLRGRPGAAQLERQLGPRQRDAHVSPLPRRHGRADLRDGGQHAVLGSAHDELHRHQRHARQYLSIPHHGHRSVRQRGAVQLDERDGGAHRQRSVPSGDHAGWSGRLLASRRADRCHRHRHDRHATACVQRSGARLGRGDRRRCRYQRCVRRYLLQPCWVWIDQAGSHDERLGAGVVPNEHQPRRQDRRLRQQPDRLVGHERPSRVHGRQWPSALRCPLRLGALRRVVDAVVQRQRLASGDGNARRRRHEAVRRWRDRCVAHRCDAGGRVRGLLAHRWRQPRQLGEPADQRLVQRGDRRRCRVPPGARRDHRRPPLHDRVDRHRAEPSTHCGVLRHHCGAHGIGEWHGFERQRRHGGVVSMGLR